MKFAVALFGLFVMQAQPRLEFEISSVKPNKSGSGASTLEFHNDKLTVINMSLKACIRWAYGVRDYQIQGPDWITSDRYDISAKGPNPVTDTQHSQMLQALLADRFKLALHRETRTLPLYRLQVAKDGPKLKQSHPQPVRESSNRTELSAQGMGMPRFADFLARNLDRPVIDETGLQGVFDFKLEWAGDNQPESDLPSLFTALQEQLGLKLEPAKGPVDILVIDHAEQPDEN